MAAITEFRRYRLAAGLTRNMLAQKVKVHWSTISTWELGKNLPRAKKLPAVARALKCTPLELTAILCHPTREKRQPKKRRGRPVPPKKTAEPVAVPAGSE